MDWGSSLSRSLYNKKHSFREMFRKTWKCSISSKILSLCPSNDISLSLFLLQFFEMNEENQLIRCYLKSSLKKNENHLMEMSTLDHYPSEEMTMDEYLHSLRQRIEVHSIIDLLHWSSSSFLSFRLEYSSIEWYRWISSTIITFCWFQWRWTSKLSWKKDERDEEMWL